MRFRFIAVLAVMLSFFALPAHAQLEICNKTAAPFSLAIAYETDTDVVSQGWWTIDPDKCEQVIKTELKHQYYYHYVVSRALGVEWAGTFNFCTNDDPQFRISGASSCEQRNYHTTGFRQINVETSKAYTLDVSMGPPPAKAAAPAAPQGAIEATPPATK